MTTSTRSQLAKLLADDKVMAIITATKDPNGLTPKQISTATKIPLNQLYYTINKMVAADLLTVVQQLKVKNLTEYYYSSYQLTQAEMSTPALSRAWVQAHPSDVTQLLLYQQQQFLTHLEQKLETAADTELDTLLATFSKLELSPAGTQKLRADLLNLIENAEKNDPDPAATDKQVNHLLIEKW
ncbi:winged helix-turn-helix domain-containing protein [Lactiplantibacillus mudanjiangensis]|uniref:Transcriptional regulator [Lactobacillus paraplantarum] n=1 Tax=Lactiplantibacillus mudanjiangensis TaxID=1296538 RepID=A0A660EAB9_9LACO|nr:helix-turn-helix domain-containing protein [Lactiplantibacillus mudanjiangensis]VDG20691.1 transcriptional regulator [Lactobacillus paraplantarum] [Lactiplantibacillus mudanjiangensis]VDG24163.1 transcriptional regulator [Lactobacillus paraplantarum] [Lactiplantibacillus mudanjiangensis]VDG30147.1 transcriptional regulator [Lactobacillus paraplantarum] [Lactiplantibacillus mudanjiangensis]VDG30631.1 transcriptional regulator [Lactobacillus paraplantarum] [Lactiplantibacillus mudanjiangensis]